MDACVAINHDHLIAERRNIGTTGGTAAKHHRYLRQSGSRHAALAMKRISEMVAVGEHPVLFRQIGPAAIHQIKAGHTVLFGDLLRAQVFFHCLVEKAAALDGSIIGDDNHMLALHKADTGNDSGRGDLIVILAPGGKWRQFQKGRARVDQSVDPVAHQMLSALMVAGAQLFRAASCGKGHACSQSSQQGL